MDVFDKLRAGEPVDMMSPEYRAAIDELRRADLALYRLNHTEPTPENMAKGLDELFDGHDHSGLALMTPTQIDFPKQMTIGAQVFINHSFTAMSIGGITLEDNVQIGPHVTIVTDNHDFENRYVLKCKGVRICKNAWIGANVTILPGVTVGENAVVAGGAVVTKDVPANTVVGGNPARVLRQLGARAEKPSESLLEQLQRQIDEMYAYSSKMYEAMEKDGTDARIAEMVNAAQSRDEIFLADQLTMMRNSMDQWCFVLRHLHEPVRFEGRMKEMPDGSFTLRGIPLRDGAGLEYVDADDRWQYGILRRDPASGKYRMLDANAAAMPLDLENLWVRTRQNIEK